MRRQNAAGNEARLEPARAHFAGMISKRQIIRSGFPKYMLNNISPINVHPITFLEIFSLFYVHGTRGHSSCTNNVAKVR